MLTRWMISIFYARERRIIDPKLYQCQASFFLRTRFIRASSATNCLSYSISRLSSLTSLLLVCRLVSPASRYLPSSRNYLFHM
jgi:hypothetical protein